MQNIAVDKIKPSRTNSHSRIDVTALADLVSSVRAHGVLQPVVVRQYKNGSKTAGEFELVCGHRRHAAASQAGLTEIPAIVRELSDAEALELQIVENLQRQDLHPLDEAEGYARLRDEHKCDVARIAERVGRSVPYVYDRLRLVGLNKDAKEMLRDGRLSAGHAVVLARLKPAEQKRALDPLHGGVFEEEILLWDPEELGDALPRARGERSLKLRTVRQFQDWIDRHVKIDLAAKDMPDLFPELATQLFSKETALRIVSITHDHHIHPDAHDGQKVLGPKSWKRADGQQGSKTCDASVMGVIVVGPHRGRSHLVCTEKTCKVHFAREQREGKQRAELTGASNRSGSKGKSNEASARARFDRIRTARARMRWEQAMPKLLEAAFEHCRKASLNASSPLGAFILKALTEYGVAPVPKGAPAGRNTEEFARLVACKLVAREIGEYNASHQFPAIAKKLGFDVEKVLNAAAPADKDVAGVCSQCGCTEDQACWKDGKRCSWANKEKTLCSACPKPAAKDAPPSAGEPAKSKPTARVKRSKPKKRGRAR